MNVYLCVCFFSPVCCPDIFDLDPVKICVFRALRLLAEKQPYPHEDFMRKWADALPIGLKADIAYLRGQAMQEPHDLIRGVRLAIVVHTPHRCINIL
jgi:hypothetical protein